MHRSHKVAGAAPPEAASPESPATPDLDSPSLFFNRELSLLDFQKRVLDEAKDAANPLLERLNFLAIVSSNLDEFFMVRVAVLKQKLASGGVEKSMDGRGVPELLDAIAAGVACLETEAYRTFREDLMPALKREGIRVLDYRAVTAAERKLADAYFRETVFPVLTPLAVDPGRPFPHISNLSLNLAVQVKGAEDTVKFARLKVPSTLPQLVAVKTKDHAEGVVCVWLEQLICANLATLFQGMEIVEAHPFHVTRDAEVAIQELESDDLLETIEEAVWRRRFRSVVRLQVGVSIPPHILSFLVENLEASASDVYRVEGPLALSRLRELHSLDYPGLKFKNFSPHTPPELMPKSKEDLFSVIRREDVLLHHPFESFQPVVDFIRKAARDPDVLAIKMTLYRVGRNSPIVKALLGAIEEGKQVSVLLELKARFDEESNIEWARALEREGVHVIYGLVGLKVHSKIAMVVRREGDTIRRYVHMGTGNYNPATARLYTDISLFTCDEEIGADACELFNHLTGYAATHHFRKLLVAPINMRSRIEELIRREIDLARAGESGHVILKTNALEDAGMIKLLYEASQAGVRVDLLVRGICCLRPGVPGVSQNIQVASIVGRFLEHSRIYYFRAGGREEVYVGSADLMPRNLNRRIEVLYPIGNPRLIRRLRDEILGEYLSDQVNARRLQSDSSYQWTLRSESASGQDSHARFLAGTPRGQ